MTAKDIIVALESNYQTADFTVPNIYFFGHPYSETDFLVVQKSGYIYDIEIKISRSDFRADFKKEDKHSILSTGAYISKHNSFYFKDDKRIRVAKGQPIPKSRPNRFYYAVPEGLIKKSEVPKYAGLLYIKPSGSVVKVKEAPLLTKEKTAFHEVLARKFYYSYLELKQFKSNNGISKLNTYIRQLEKKVDEQEKRIQALQLDKMSLKYDLEDCKK